MAFALREQMRLPRSSSCALVLRFLSKKHDTKCIKCYLCARLAWRAGFETACTWT